MKPISLVMLCFLYSCSDSDIRKLQIMNNGRELYTQNCSNCHQPKGEGIKGIVPPLKDADYLLLNPEKLPCIIRNGMEGNMIVNQQMYKQKMPPNKKLSDREIAFISNYVLNTFADHDQLINMDSNDFTTLFKSCKE